jgi:YVTN family beta-propeller protein
MQIRGNRTLLIVGVLALAAASASKVPAHARNAYVVNGASETVSVIDVSTNTVVGAPLPLPSTAQNPESIAISPDGTRAYVPFFFNHGFGAFGGGLAVIDTATNTVSATSIPLGFQIVPEGIAITPDGARAYVTESQNDTVLVVDLAAGAVTGSPIAVGPNPEGIAITPDGSRAIVVNSNTAGNTGSLTVINTASNQANFGTIALDELPVGIAITPNGARAYVANSGPGFVSAVDTASDSVVDTVGVQGVHTRAVAISPDGTKAFAAGRTEVGFGGFSVIATATNADTVPALIGMNLHAVAVTPDGTRAYAVDPEAGSIFAIDTTTSSVAATIPSAGAVGIAVTPNQPPAAAFAATPKPAELPTAFDASATTDPDGIPVRFDWDFGDGAKLPDGGPTPTHAYAEPGEYTVILTVTDNEGCSLNHVFTGQTALCNGGPVAQIRRTVTIPPPDRRSPGLELRGLRKQKLDGAVEVRAISDEPCGGKGGGKLVVSRPAASGKSGVRRRTFKLKPMTVELETGEPRTLTLKIPSTARRQTAAALAAGGKARARITVQASDEAGNESASSRNVRLSAKEGK